MRGVANAPDVSNVARNASDDARDVEVPERKLNATQSRIYTFASSRKEGGYNLVTTAWRKTECKSRLKIEERRKKKEDSKKTALSRRKKVVVIIILRVLCRCNV